jgi:hypothetical protein
MWLYIIAVFLLVVGIVGSVVSGGIFTIVLVPLGVIALVTAGIVTLWARSQQGRAGQTGDSPEPSEEPLPTGHSNAPAAPSTPEDLVNARREAQ